MYWTYTEFKQWVDDGCDESKVKEVHTLSLHNNNLSSLPECVGQLANLHKLNLHNNNLTSLPESFGQLANLHTLDLRFNNLTSLPESFGQLANLHALYIYNNALSSLPESFGQLANLRTLDLRDNNLTSLPPCLGNFRHLRIFWYSSNPVEHIPANVLRMINRTKTRQGVYADIQSVHNSSIQKSLLDSINRLLQIPLVQKEVIELILQDLILTDETKAQLVEYSEDVSVHTVLNLTFSEMLVVVWNRINALESRYEIKKTLNTEMQDAECKCLRALARPSGYWANLPTCKLSCWI